MRVGSKAGVCAWCGKPHGQSTGHVNRSVKAGAPIYCGRKCAGLGRRKPPKTKAQKVAEKAVYDAAYRIKNLASLQVKRAAYFQCTYDPKKAAKYRKSRMHLHIEYCRQPEYKAYKHQYDKQRRDREYGPFAEAARLAIDLSREIKSRTTRYEIYSENETLNKKQGRSRQGPEAYSRDRHPEAKG